MDSLGLFLCFFFLKIYVGFVLRYFYECAEAMQLVLAACKPKAKIVDICEKGDAFIKE